MKRKHQKVDSPAQTPSNDKKTKIDEQIYPESNPKPVNFPIQYILAPMVGASELAFRLLCRNYGAQAAYTPMMQAQKFADDPHYRQEEFQTCKYDRPLVCHFAANDPQDFARACQAAEPYCDAIDLNLGCPQRTAYLGHFGSYLLDQKDRLLICRIIAAGNEATRLPIFVKIRLLDTIEETIQLCRQLRKAGASLIAIHARYRATWQRKGPGARDGPALLDQVEKIRQVVTDIPIVANGNVITYEDVVNNQATTKASGIMSAEGILDNPALFLPSLDASASVSIVTAREGIENEKTVKARKKLKSIEKIERRIKEKGSNALTEKERKKLKKKDKYTRKLEASVTIGRVDISFDDLQTRAKDPLNLAREYLAFTKVFPVKIRSVIFHVRRMLKNELTQYQLMEECISCEVVSQIEQILTQMEVYRRQPERFVYDKEKAQREKEALERKKREEGKRNEYEARMIRKAKREGKTDLNYYLHIGAELPSKDEIIRLKGLPKDKALSVWKERHSQHCLSFHLDAEGCKRGRGCAFLHMDVIGKNVFNESDEVAG